VVLQHGAHVLDRLLALRGQHVSRWLASNGFPAFVPTRAPPKALRAERICELRHRLFVRIAIIIETIGDIGKTITLPKQRRPGTSARACRRYA
jgi:hypothetical protein